VMSDRFRFIAIDAGCLMSMNYCIVWYCSVLYCTVLYCIVYRYLYSASRGVSQTEALFQCILVPVHFSSMKKVKLCCDDSKIRNLR